MSKVDELRAKYPKVTNAVINKFIEGDKTKTKKYLPFMLKTWVDRTSEITNSTHLVQLVNMFDELLPYIENKDIYHKDYGSITHFLSVLNDAMVDKEENTFNRDEHAEVIEETDDYILLHPKTHRGSLKYGANTKWCTASKNSPSTFTSYSKNGFLVYLLSKKDKGPVYTKLAFYIRKHQDMMTGFIECYNMADKEFETGLLIDGNYWEADTLFKLITKIRLKAYQYQKLMVSKERIEDVLIRLESVNFETLTSSIEVLEKMNNIDYISNAKQKINDFVSKLEKIKI
jgi:hypothetical protein